MVIDRLFSPRRVRSLVALSALAVAVVYSGACSRATYIDGWCSIKDDCLTSWNYAGGTECLLDRCVCPNPEEAICCPDGTRSCKYDQNACRPKAICAVGTVLPATSTAVASSSGGEPAAECTTDEECPGTPDFRCGSGRCKEGKCELEIATGESIASQFPGDCNLTICTNTGALRNWPDPSDVPRDGNPCTWDVCSGGVPANTALPDGTPCPGEDLGICVLGKCQECSQPLGIDSCKAGEFCDWDRCTPLVCNDGVKSTGETDTDCGGAACGPCDYDGLCLQGSDCFSGVCDAFVCQKSTHSDGILNGSESGTDCGYPDGPLGDCDDGQGCNGSLNCKSRVCYLGVCQKPTCSDARQNGAENNADCGGDCAPCQ